RQVAVRLEDSKVERDPKALKLIAKDPDGFRRIIQGSEQQLRQLPDASWEPAVLETELRALSQSLDLAAEAVYQAIRIAVTGGTVSEPLHTLLAAVGKEGTLARLRAA